MLGEGLIQCLHFFSYFFRVNTGQGLWRKWRSNVPIWMPSGMSARRLVQRKPKPSRRFEMWKLLARGEVYIANESWNPIGMYTPKNSQYDSQLDSVLHFWTFLKGLDLKKEVVILKAWGFSNIKPKVKTSFKHLPPTLFWTKIFPLSDWTFRNMKEWSSDISTNPLTQAVEILDADEAHENFAKTFSPSFLQDIGKDGWGEYWRFEAPRGRPTCTYSGQRIVCLYNVCYSIFWLASRRMNRKTPFYIVHPPNCAPLQFGRVQPQKG